MSNGHRACHQIWVGLDWIQGIIRQPHKLQTARTDCFIPTILCFKAILSEHGLKVLMPSRQCTQGFWMICTWNNMLNIQHLKNWTCLNNFDGKFVPWSVWMIHERPNVEKSLVRALTTELPLLPTPPPHSRMASGKWVAVQTANTVTNHTILRFLNNRDFSIGNSGQTDTGKNPVICLDPTWTQELVLAHNLSVLRLVLPR